MKKYVVSVALTVLFAFQAYASHSAAEKAALDKRINDLENFYSAVYGDARDKGQFRSGDLKSSNIELKNAANDVLKAIKAKSQRCKMLAADSEDSVWNACSKSVSDAEAAKAKYMVIRAKN